MITPDIDVVDRGKDGNPPPETKYPVISPVQLMETGTASAAMGRNISAIVARVTLFFIITISQSGGTLL